MKRRSDTTVGFAVKFLLKMYFKKHVEKIHKIEQPYKTEKKTSCNKSWFQKVELNYPTI